MDRPEFVKLRELLKEEDTLVVTKLDRFARSVGQASDLITELIDKEVKVNVLNLGILSNDSVSTLMRNVLLSFAQFERDMIVERTQEGKRSRSRIRTSGKDCRRFTAGSRNSMHWNCWKREGLLNR